MVYNIYMVGARFFNGGRDASRMGAASEIMRLEIMKKGKLPAADRYKHILQKKLSADKDKAMGGRVKVGFSLPGSLPEARKMSKLAEQKIKEIAQRKAAKEAKRIRKMVLITPRTYQNGKLDKKGKIIDIAGNVVGQVNAKNGKMATMHGWSLGKYKPKSYLTDVTIQNAINLHSPYFVNLRKQQLLQQQGVTQYGVFGPPMGGTEVINVYSPAQNSFDNNYGSDLSPARQNVSATAWGARSDNVWGSFADNTWGTFADNVWGGNSSDVWGGVGAGNLWGQKGPSVWGTGSGRNYIAKFTNSIAAFFGLSTKQNRQRLQSLNRAASSRSASSGGARTAAAPSAPTGGKR
jgi:hypothetical protein